MGFIQTDKPMSAKQREVIHAMVSEREIDPEQVRASIRNISGKTRLDDMNAFEASKLIDELKLIPNPRRNGNGNGSRASNGQTEASQNQINFITDLIDEKGLTEDEVVQLLKKAVGKVKVEELTRDDASRVIEALKGSASVPPQRPAGQYPVPNVSEAPAKATPMKSNWQPEDERPVSQLLIDFVGALAEQEHMPGSEIDGIAFEVGQTQFLHDLTWKQASEVIRRMLARREKL